MTTPSAEARGALALRKPALAFGALWLLIVFAIGLALAAWAASGVTQFDPAAAQALALPIALATGLAGAMTRRRFARAAIYSHVVPIWRVVSAFAAMGLAWPLSFGLSALTQGDADTAFVQALTAPILALIGAPIGALAGAAATYICTQIIEAPGNVNV